VELSGSCSQDEVSGAVGCPQRHRRQVDVEIVMILEDSLHCQPLHGLATLEPPETLAEAAPDNETRMVRQQAVRGLPIPSQQAPNSVGSGVCSREIVWCQWTSLSVLLGEERKTLTRTYLKMRSNRVDADMIASNVSTDRRALGTNPRALSGRPTSTGNESASTFRKRTSPKVVPDVNQSRLGESWRRCFGF
jgi:hypothetical protein